MENVLPIYDNETITGYYVHLRIKREDEKEFCKWVHENLVGSSIFHKGWLPANDFYSVTVLTEEDVVLLKLRWM